MNIYNPKLLEHANCCFFIFKDWIGFSLQVDLSLCERKWNECLAKADGKAKSKASSIEFQENTAIKKIEI